MTTHTYVLCAAAAIVSAAFHVFAVKIPLAKKSAAAGNIKFSVGDYLENDWPAIAANIAAITIGLFIAGEAINYKPELEGYIVTVFAFYGFAGSSLLIALFGQVGDKINKIVDVKTTIADGTDEKIDTIGKK